MAIMRWTPFSAFTSLEREMQSFFDRMLGSERPLMFRERAPFVWRPAVDMTREDGNMVIRAELPGIDPEKDLEIEVEDNVLHIRGERHIEREIDEEDRYLSERFVGHFERNLMLPEGVDPDKLEASYQKGVLTVRVPVPVEALPKGKKIEVKIEE